MLFPASLEFRASGAAVRFVPGSARKRPHARPEGRSAAQRTPPTYALVPGDGAGANVPHLDMPGPAIAAVRAAPGPPGAQAAGQLSAQLTAALHVRRLVDGSWLTLIMGSSGNSIRNRAAICTGDHHSSSQEQTRAASCGQASLQGLGGRACSRAR